MKLPPVLTGIVLDPAAGTLDFSALGAGFDPRTVLGVLHEPTNRFIFAKGRAGLSYVSIAGSVMKLAADTTGLAAGPLTGFYDDGALIATDARLEACRALLATGNTALSNLYTALGTPADAAPGSDAAAGSVIAKLTRSLMNWTTALASLGAPGDTAIQAVGGSGSLIAQVKGLLARALLVQANPGGSAAVANAVQGVANGYPIATVSTAAIVTADTSGAIAAGGTASIAANLARGLLVLTNTGPNPLAYRFGGAATALLGHVLAPGDTVRFDAKVPTAAVSLFSTAGTSFFATTG